MLGKLSDILSSPLVKISGYLSIRLVILSDNLSIFVQIEENDPKKII
jgi:hypothetical protein